VKCEAYSSGAKLFGRGISVVSKIQEKSYQDAHDMVIYS